MLLGGLEVRTLSAGVALPVWHLTAVNKQVQSSSVRIADLPTGQWQCCSWGEWWRGRLC